ncbi:MAG: hypothetical protein QHH12_00500 [Candidatus Bathyarchaeota archaeon]|jgi:TRAP-type uncharacterized transport system substrate-binding protein|nr:hypothetical protein [Candidatus Bathyarchaeota archaeon A05DMB-3]MDH7606236.1 hypothetical protein [Candidatus Bathyarchaeota archaeon]
MGAKNRKTQRKINLLEMSDTEKAKIIEQLKQNLRRSISEAKLWKALLQYETVTVNGQVVFSGEDSLNGLLMPKTNL